tara:strand:- start:8650 stop:9321 length:672 start_codon:yes stop_codon:yes gene_type:complete
MPVETPQGKLDFKNVNRVTFYGTSSNTIVRTDTASLGIGVTSSDISSNLFVNGNAYVSTGLTVNSSSNLNAINLSGHILPTVNAQYDLGSAEYKIRHLFLSDNSLWLGDETKLSFSNNQVKFRKRKKNITPAAILELPGASETEALQFSKKETVNDMKLENWIAYAKTKKPEIDISDIFRDDDTDFETTSISEDSIKDLEKKLEIEKSRNDALEARITALEKL